jgi:hypothetical protein
MIIIHNTYMAIIEGPNQHGTIPHLHQNSHVLYHHLFATRLLMEIHLIFTFSIVEDLSMMLTTFVGSK